MKLFVKTYLWCVACVTMAAADEGWFWHVTDFHWDFSYWTQQLSCNGAGPQHPGQFGNQWCDSPWRLIEETIMGMSNTKADVDFMLWTGDNVPHVADAHLSRQLNEELVRNITMEIKSQFSNVPVYATFGNHDYFPANKYPPHGNEIYNDTYIIWKSWINDATQETAFLKGGYYTKLVSPGLRIVALNTNLYYTSDTVTHNLTDPADQFSWLENVLITASGNNEKVIVTGHVPPGYATPFAKRWMMPAYNARFLDILGRHAHSITAMHFGHEHHDSFRILYSSTGSPELVLFLAPSVTPWRYQGGTEKEPFHNPGVRLVRYDRQTGKMLEILQYFVDLSASNTDGTLHWQLGYNATQLYGVPDLSPASMHAVAKKLDRLGSPEFSAYTSWYNTDPASNPALCDQRCHKVVLCGIRNMDDDGFQKCLQAQTSCSTNINACPIVG